MFSLRELSVITLAMASIASAATIPLKPRTDGAKRLLLWDYTNTQNPAVAAQMDSIRFDESQITGVMNWNSWYPSELKERAPFEPMIRTMAETTGENWQFLVERLQSHRGSIVHFFNEPDMNGISPEQAAQVWNDQFVGLRRDFDAKLVGPAVASNEAGTTWLNSFMSQIGSNPPDFLGLHYYGGDAGAAMQYIRDRHNDHPFPVIVSEIAARDVDEAGKQAFTCDVSNQLDNEDFVHEYAFFGAMATLPNDGGFTTAADLLFNLDGAFKPLFESLLYNKPM